MQVSREPLWLNSFCCRMTSRSAWLVVRGRGPRRTCRGTPDISGGRWSRIVQRSCWAQNPTCSKTKKRKHARRSNTTCEEASSPTCSATSRDSTRTPRPPSDSIHPNLRRKESHTHQLSPQPCCFAITAHVGSVHEIGSITSCCPNASLETKLATL